MQQTYNLDWVINKIPTKSNLIFGVGLARDDDKIHNPLNWQGLNLLGFALMMVRDNLLECDV